MPRLKIGIVGCGAIGTSLSKYIALKLSKKAQLVGLYDIDGLKAEKLSLKICHNKGLAMSSLEKLIRKSNLVIEAASSSGSWKITRIALRQGRDVMAMSVGGLISRLKELKVLANKYRARVYIPSGAISGVDALKAARMAGIKKVTLTTRKNPLSFKGVKYVMEKGLRLEGIRKDRVIFSGPAVRAVKYFPQNINVASVLSLAGIGKENTWVRIIASPSASRNIHEIKIESTAGNIFSRTENVLHPDNPKTSYLAVLSAQAVLNEIIEPVRIGS